MATDLRQERQRAHDFLDQLPAAQRTAVRTLIESMVDPVAQAIAQAPIDDEALTEEDRQAIAEAEEWRKHNEGRTLETVLAEFGLGLNDWERTGNTRPEERG